MKNYKIQKVVTTTDTELLEAFMKDGNLNKGEALKLIKIWTQCIRDRLVKSGFCNIRRLGRFVIKSRKKLRFRAPNGEEMTLPIIYHIHFYAADSFKFVINRVNQEKIDEIRKLSIS
jgi:nucleoid DNA-binding protein